jgi:tetratricopeptide (TPR) repeat protein
MPRMRAPYCFFILLIVGVAQGQTPVMDSLKKAIKISGNDTARVNLLYELSRLQCSELELASALKSGKMAESISEKAKFKPGLAKAYHAIGNVYIQEGNYPNALEMHLKALKLKEELNDVQGLSASYNNIGRIYNSIHDYDKAFFYYHKSLNLKYQLLRKAKAENKEKEVKRLMLSIASSSNSLGTNFDETENFKEALNHFGSALSIHEQYNNAPGMEACWENMGVTFYKMGNHRKALAYFTKVYDQRKSRNDTNLLAGTYLNLGKANLKLKNFENARKFLNRSLALSQSIRMTDVTRDSYLGLYQLERRKKNSNAALFYVKRFVKYRDSISNEAVTKRMTRLQLTHEFEQKEKEAQLLQEKKDAVTREKSEFQNVIIIGMTVVLVIIIGFVIYALINFKEKQKINKAITRQKEIIEEKQNEIIASITYAKRIQSILLPSEQYIDKELTKLTQIKP